ncbi:MAG TPA: tetratricopeptide repeat protein [Rudaea sp.]|nr:tetratricopeptide repeat protein [Rudaea sp.]
MNLKRCLYGALCAGLLLLPAFAAADALIKPLPVPDTSKLSAGQVTELTTTRAQFDKLSAGLVGPPLAQAYADIGALYARAGFKDVAAIAFYDATLVDAHDARWFYLRGVIAREQKQDAEARANFEAALAIDNVYLPISYRLSDTLVDLGDLDAARRLLEGVVREHPEQAAAAAMLGQVELRQKRYADAAKHLSGALKLEPAANALYKPLAEAYAGLGNAQAAQDAQAKAGNVTPSLADPLVVGLYGGGNASNGGTPLQQAQQLAVSGHLDQARARLGEVLREHPDDIDALALQARMEASSGDPRVARAAADKVLKIAPDSAVALFANGLVHEYAGQDDPAYAFYQRAVRADGTMTTARLLLGNAEMRRGRYAQAAEQYRQLAVLQPDESKAQAHLVAAEVAAGQCLRALADISAMQARSAKNGDLMQIFVRLASTCPGAKAEERDMALDYAQTLYDQRAAASDSAALALALAAHGKFKEAQQYQAEAIFDAVRRGDKDAADMYRSTQASFVAGKVPDRPWPARHAYFKPPMLTPVQPAPAPATP